MLRVPTACMSSSWYDTDLRHPSHLLTPHKSKAWGSGDPANHLPSTEDVYYDDHRYYSYDSSIETTKEGYMAAVCDENRGTNSILIGECSISVAKSVRTNSEFEIDNRPDQVEWYRGYWAAQAQTFEKSGGWIFWTWKCNWMAGLNDWRWCYQSAVAAGAIPDDASTASSLSPC